VSDIENGKAGICNNSSAAFYLDHYDLTFGGYVEELSL